jgi:glycosyltransferase involved in cell wall biosynthesis
MIIFIFSKSSWNVYNFRKNLIKKLISDRHDIFVIAKKDKNVKKLKKLGCKFIDINFENDSFNFLKDLAAFIKIFLLIKNFKPDLFLNFNIKPVIIGSIICNFMNIKVVNTITGLGNAFLGSLFLKKIAIFLYKIAISDSNKVIFHNYDDKKIFIKERISKRFNSFVVLGSGVDTNYFKFSKLSKKKIIFLFVGRLLWNKGIMRFIEVSNHFKNNKKVLFYVLGECTDDLKNGITSSSLKNLKKKYNFKYFKFKRDVRLIIKKSTCVVSTSYREGASKVLLESASMGRPLISSNISGAKNIVYNDYNGYTFDLKNKLSLKNKINKFLKLSFNKKQKMSKNSRLLATHKFNEQHVISKYLQIIT